jgi:hypothetical protein
VPGPAAGAAAGPATGAAETVVPSATVIAMMATALAVRRHVT